MRLLRTNLCEATVGGFDLVVSRTGYTGEKMAFELFVHPDKAQDLFRTLLEVGEPFGLKPIGLGARDSLRLEAGLPLYGHELGLDPEGNRARMLHELPDAVQAAEQYLALSDQQQAIPAFFVAPV